MDPANDPRWCPKVRSVKQVAPRGWTVLHKPVPLCPPVELSLEQLELDMPSRITMRAEDDWHWKKLPRVVDGIFAQGVRRDVRAQLQELKRVLEGTSTGS